MTAIRGPRGAEVGVVPNWGELGAAFPWFGAAGRQLEQHQPSVCCLAFVKPEQFLVRQSHLPQIEHPTAPRLRV